MKEFTEFKEFDSPEEKDYDLKGEHTINEEKTKNSIQDAFDKLYFDLGCPEDYELSPYGFTKKDFENPNKESLMKLRNYAADYKLKKDNSKGRK